MSLILIRINNVFSDDVMKGPGCAHSNTDAQALGEMQQVILFNFHYRVKQLHLAGGFILETLNFFLNDIQ